MRLLSDSIGRKVVMAITGLLMVLFVVGHLLGNMSIFAGANGINTYAEKLHAMAPVVWITRVVMGVAVLLHLFISLQITAENQAANPTKYAQDRSLRANLFSKSMIYTGLIIGAFIAYHLLHFTVRAGFTGAVVGMEGGRFDVYTMVTTAFSNALVALIYVVAVASLFMHLSHGIQSTFQSLGLANHKTQPQYMAGGKAMAAVFLLGYGAIPVLILIGLVGK